MVAAIFRLACLLSVAGFVSAEPMRLTWPVPNPGFLQNRPLESFIQPTATGITESGLYGCVRNSGYRFHEGIDLSPIGRDRRGEATDPIAAVADGIVRHVSRAAGESGYGRYIVLEHPELVPAVFTLYAHLASVEPSISVGAPVRRGQRLGVMGRSAGGYSIPADRAHLHFEIGLRLSSSFDAWYRTKGFGNPNRHGNFNGMNLAGFDPLAFFEQFRKGKVRQPLDYLKSLPVAVTVRVQGRDLPDFGRRYPELVETGELLPVAWEVDFDVYAVPLRLRGVAASAEGGIELVSVTPSAIEIKCIDLVDTRRLRRGSAQVPGKDLREALELLFGRRL